MACMVPAGKKKVERKQNLSRSFARRALHAIKACSNENGLAQHHLRAMR
jgi:hypothetical protein